MIFEGFFGFWKSYFVYLCFNCSNVWFFFDIYDLGFYFSFVIWFKWGVWLGICICLVVLLYDSNV